MSERLARRYDLVNTVLSAGTDAGWRRHAARETRLGPGGSALDVACGSGKLTAELSKIAAPNGRVVGLDFSPQMLEVARREHPGIEFIESDALKLPFDDASFDATTIAFGLRNLADPILGLRETDQRRPESVQLHRFELAHGRVDKVLRFLAHARQRSTRRHQLRDATDLAVAKRAGEQAPHFRTHDPILRGIDQRKRKYALADVEADRFARAGAEVDHVVGHLEGGPQEVAEAAERLDHVRCGAGKKRARFASGGE